MMGLTDFNLTPKAKKGLKEAKEREARDKEREAAEKEREAERQDTTEGSSFAQAAAIAISKQKSGDYHKSGKKKGLRKTKHKNPDHPKAKTNKQRKKEKQWKDEVEESKDIKQAKVKKQLQKIKGITNKQIEIILTLPPAVLTQMITQVSQLVSGDEIYERDYKKERENYLGTPEQKKRNAARKRARRALEKEGRVKPFDGKDVHHKDNNPENNDRSNLRVANRSTNRREPRLREGLDEGKLVADINAIFDAIVKSVKKRMGKEYQTNQERGLRFVNQVASLVGGKVTDKKQQKGKLFYKTK